MHHHRSQKHYLYAGYLLLLGAGIFLGMWWRSERERFWTLRQYQLQLTQLQQLTVEQALHSWSDALLKQGIASLDSQAQKILTLLPPEQATKRSATQSAALAGLLLSWVQEDTEIEPYTRLTSRLMQLVTLPPTESTLADLLALRQQYEQLATQPHNDVQLQRILHNTAVLDTMLQLRAREQILTQTNMTKSALTQAYEAIHLVLEENKRLISFLEQAPIIWEENAPKEDLLDCRANLLHAFRREQQEAIRIMTLLPLAQDEQMPIFQQCISERETCLTQPQWHARHTGLQEVSSGVIALAKKYVQLHALRAQGAPLDAQQLCVRRNKLPQTPTDIQDDLERALEHQQQLLKAWWTSWTAIDQTGSARTEKIFDNRQENALQEIEQRQEQWLQETDASSWDSFRDRIEQFFEQFDGKR